MELPEEHELQVQGYLRFAKLKRDQHVRETLSVIREFKAEHLTPGEMYNFKDLSTLMTKMEGEVQELVDKEIQHAYHTQALLLKLLLSQAASSGVSLSVDTAALEDELLLRAIARSEQQALSRPATDFARRAPQLGKLGAGTTLLGPAGADSSAKADKEEIEGLRERLKQVQEAATAAARERSALAAELAALKSELAKKDALVKGVQEGTAGALAKLQADFAALSTRAEGAAQASSAAHAELAAKAGEQRSELERVRQELHAAQQQLATCEKELRQARDALDGRLSEAPQFTAMRKLMAAKSAEVVELRRRLAKHEPDALPPPSADE